VNLTKNKRIFKMWTDSDTLKMHLYSCSYCPEDGHVRGRNISAVSM